MHKILTFLFVVFSFSAQAGAPSTPASWHYLGKISKVAVLGDRFHVRGTNPTGHVCPDRSNFYGTVTLTKGQPGFNEYYSMALAGYFAGKSMSCHISSEESNGYCVMTNCYLH